MTRLILLSIILSSFLGSADLRSTQPVYFQPIASSAEEIESYNADLALAQRYLPVLYFHPDEVYSPQPVDVVLGISRLRQSKRMWFDTTLLNTSSMQALFTVPSDETYFLDQWLGDTGSSEYGNYSSHQAIYATSFNPRVSGMEATVYAHIVRNERLGTITLQYWLFYFYNDWYNKHEGDWEMVEVILASHEQPIWVIYSQHHGGVRRSWETTPLDGNTHPIVYVARGSHANYFYGNEIYPYPQGIGNRQLVLVDRTGISTRILTNIILIPTRSELASNPDRWKGAEWLMYRGRWGETAVSGDFNGPYGPADKGLQWDEPYIWGIAQPLDEETWYKNRLRVEVIGLLQTQAHIWLTDNLGKVLPQSDQIGNQVILHGEPPDRLMAHIDGMSGTQGDLVVSWPDRMSKSVTKMRFSTFELDSSGHAQLELAAGQVAYLSTTSSVLLASSLLDTYTTVWDAPDSVLVGNHLPIPEIMGGLATSLVISLVPILILVAILYWVDRYQKKSVRHLAGAFFWGAIPALLIALSLQLFFKLPPNLLGSNALEAVRLGLLAPVLEETLKAAGVLIIYWRSRKEINDVLDGIIYGAMVGFGFAFVSTLSRYVGNFIAYGYSGLSLGLIAERTINALDHGLYTAIFGIGLGLLILDKNRRRSWIWPMLALFLAIATHALHNLLTNSLVGLNVFSVAITSAGTLILWVVAGWSLVMQRQLLRKELHGLVHDSLYSTILDPFGRAKAQWHALRRDGFRAWIQVRRLQGLCIKLANVQLQARLDPDKYKQSNEANSLQEEIKRIFDGFHPITR